MKARQRVLLPPSNKPNRSRLRSWLGIAWITAGALGTLAAGGPIDTARLIGEMTDLTGLAEWPNPPYTCKQFSSYDRKAKSPTENWFANDDHSQFLRVEDRAGRKEYVLMDTDGPGAIVRIWSANPAGTLYFYFDGAEQPGLVSKMADLLGGKHPGLPRPISGEYSKGWNLYFPIPYARHCKVTCDAGNFYYHVNYRTYPAGTAVETFRPEILTTLAPQIQTLAARLARPRGDVAANAPNQSFEFELPAGESFRHEFYGPAAFARVVLKVTSAQREAALRGIVIRVTFDGEKCIESPLGDMFGTAPGINPFEALPTGMTADGEMYCHWYMPFRDSATIELANQSSTAATLSGEVALVDHRWTDASMHFHAKWRAQFDVPTRPMQDWNYLTAHGQGVFAGVAFAIDNPVKDWWGEGDEKIYVDGETFPSHFGTGTEDYYGYAWCWPALFNHAYHAQPRCDGPGNYGRTSVNRFHIADRIPFTKDFRFDMELWHWNQGCKVNMAVVAYWYARPGATDAFKPVRAEDTIVRPMPVYVIPRVAGALEGESMPIRKVVGTADPQDWEGLSGGKHLWWHEGMKPGDTLAVVFQAPKAGKYHVFGRFLRARDYGRHQLAINGQKTGAPIDFYNPQVTPSAETDLGVFTLRAGENEFSATVEGANPAAVKAFMFGLDYLRLQAVD
jgi:hypothetical protein